MIKILYPVVEEGYEGKVAITTGEKRAPKAGEWYISGAIPEVYLAYQDMTTEFWIAKLAE